MFPVRLIYLEQAFSVCKVRDYSQVRLDAPFCFIGKTEEEKSLVCLEEDVPNNVVQRKDGWRAFFIEGSLDFSLVGILAKITGVLSAQKIGIFAISTYQTDYILVQEEQVSKAREALLEAGYEILASGGTR